MEYLIFIMKFYTMIELKDCHSKYHYWLTSDWYVIGNFPSIYEQDFIYIKKN